MSRFIIERYIHDALSARAIVAGDGSATRRELALNILRDIHLYFADHMEDVRDAHGRLAQRSDPEGREMLAFVDATLASYETADRVARDAIARARRS